MSDDVGLDLHLDLSGTRSGRSLEVALRDALLDGRISAGTRLPAARTLGADLGISRNTVAGVYAQLGAEGWLESRVGSGTWVSDRVDETRRARPTPTTEPDRRRIDLRAGIPDPSAFPRREWLGAVRAATSQAAMTDLGYPEAAGAARLRTALAGYLARTRGVVADPGHVVVGQGFSDLLTLISRSLRDRGVRRIAVEEYGHATHRRSLAATGLDLVPIRVDADGADVAQLASSGAGAVLLTPAHQFPLGVPLSPDRRRQLTRWAELTGAWVLEDDYDGEFRYDRRAVGALQALTPDHVAYLGTASKALAPAVGIAWAVLPPDLLPGVVDHRILAGGPPSALHQLALAAFVEDHAYDRSVRRSRSVYRSRRARLAEHVAEHLPDCGLTGMSAGLQGLLRLPSGADERQVEREAERRGMRLEGLTAFRAAPSVVRAPALVIGYGGATPARFEAALTILVDSIRAST